MRFNVNTDEVVRFTNKLEKLNKSAFPVAIRGTLNDAAYNVKTDTMPISARNTFKHREKNFFKANSKFEKAVGFNISAMHSDVGFYENRLKNQGHNYAVSDLEQQEYGGSIGGKALIPMKAARVSGMGKVRANARMASIKNKIINANKVKSVGKRFRKQRFIRAAIKARELNGDNAFILGNMTNGSQTLFRVTELWTGTRSNFKSFGSRKLLIKLIALYRVKKGRAVNVKPTDFMRRASVTTLNRMDDYYFTQAVRQFKKAGVLK